MMKSSTLRSTAGDSFTSRVAVLTALLSTVGWRLRRNRPRSAGRNGGLSASLIDQHRRGRREPAISALPHPQFDKTPPDNREVLAALTLLSGRATQPELWRVSIIRWTQRRVSGTISLHPIVAGADECPTAIVDGSTRPLARGTGHGRSPKPRRVTARRLPCVFHANYSCRQGARTQSAALAGPGSNADFVAPGAALPSSWAPKRRTVRILSANSRM